MAKKEPTMVRCLALKILEGIGITPTKKAGQEKFLGLLHLMKAESIHVYRLQTGDGWMQKKNQ
jgi:hypothetical protein